MSEKSWAAFGKWAFVSLATALFFFGIACLVGRVDEVKRPVGIVPVLLGAWMIIVLYRSPEARARRKFVSSKRRTK